MARGAWSAADRHANQAGTADTVEGNTITGNGRSTVNCGWPLVYHPQFIIDP